MGVNNPALNACVAPICKPSTFAASGALLVCYSPREGPYLKRQLSGSAGGLICRIDEGARELTAPVGVADPAPAPNGCSQPKKHAPKMGRAYPAPKESQSL